MSVDEAHLIELLTTADQLGSGAATPQIRALLTAMMERAGVYGPPVAVTPPVGSRPPSAALGGSNASLASAGSGSAGKATKKKAEEGPPVKAECVVCAQEGTGHFRRRGFKCNACVGLHKEDVLPAGQSPHDVPSVNGTATFVAAAGPDGVSGNATQDKYMLFRLPLASAVPLPELQDRAAELRELYHPTLLYNFALAVDARRGHVNVLHENTQPLGTAVRSVEAIKQIALSALQGVSFLAGNGLAHNDLRPYNFFVDALRTVKVRMAPFAAAPLPAPFCAPETAAGVADEADLQAAARRDIYALGVTLTIFAYGAPLAFPNDGDVVFAFEEEELLARYLRRFVDPDPEKRFTAAAALADDYVQTVRVHDGVPVETVMARVLPLAADDPLASPAAATDDSGTSVVYFCPASEGSTNEAAAILKEFFAGGGTDYQIVTTSTHATIYSAAKDPLRKGKGAAARQGTTERFSIGGSQADFDDSQGSQASFRRPRGQSFEGGTANDFFRSQSMVY
jgi:hypothetical protein